MSSITSEREKIPLGWHFILKTSVIEQAMRTAGIDTAVHINFFRNDQILLDARFYLPNERVKFPRFYLRVGMVETKNYISHRNIWEKEVPQALAQWMRKYLDRLEKSEVIDKPRLACGWENEGLVIKEEE